MANPEQESETTDGVDRRTMLKGTATAGIAGSALSGTASAHPNTIVFESASDEVCEYEVTVSDEIHRGGQWESDSGDEILNDGHTVRGAVSERRKDSFEFGGRIEDLDVDGLGRVFVNGDKIMDTSEKKLPNEITVEGKGERVQYKFRVGGDVKKGPEAGEADDVDGNTVRGEVFPSDVDDFRYSGPLVFDKSDGPLKVTLRLDP